MGAGLLVAVCILFSILNRGAYQGYFADDELDSLSWAPHLSKGVWIGALATPRFLTNNFRPAGHLYYYVLGRTAKMHFAPYVAVLQALHLMNAFLLWLLARRLHLNWWAAATAAAFFALNAAALDAYWKPMYVFDVMCATFCLTSLLLYMNRQWALCFLSFWIAYKTKELAVMLPAIFLVYEFALGERKWKRVAPFFLVSLSFGIQGLVFNPNKNNEYAFQFTWKALAGTTRYYSSRLLLMPFGALILAVPAFLLRDRRIWFGLAIICLFVLPLLGLPGRVYPAYVYLPEIGAAIVIATAFTYPHPGWALVFFAAWIPWNIRELRIDRQATLAAAEEARPYVTSIIDFARTHPRPPPIIFDNAPLSFHPWGIAAAVNVAWNRTDLQPRWRRSPEGAQLLKGDDLVYMAWDPPHRQMHFLQHHPGSRDASYLRMNEITAPWQMRSGFEDPEKYGRWIGPQAEALLWEPAGDREFEVIADIRPESIESLKAASLTVYLDGKTIGTRTFTEPGKQRVQFQVSTPAAHEVDIRFVVEPAYEAAGKRLGIPIRSFGFPGP